MITMQLEKSQSLEKVGKILQMSQNVVKFEDGKKALVIGKV